MNRAELMQHMAKGGYRLHQEQGQTPPEAPTISDTEKALIAGRGRRTALHGESEGYDGSTGKRPLKVNVETIGFKGLIKLACELNVPHDDYIRWLDDEWPDKTDNLRVAVAEAMERIGK